MLRAVDVRSLQVLLVIEAAVYRVDSWVPGLGLLWGV